MRIEKVSENHMDGKIKYNEKIAEALIAELREDVSEGSIPADVFSNPGNEKYEFNTRVDGMSFRIDCDVAHDENYPGKGSILYLQVQDSKTPSGTYANVVYPKTGYLITELVDAIIQSLETGENYYLV